MEKFKRFNSISEVTLKLLSMNAVLTKISSQLFEKLLVSVEAVSSTR